jgi:hypothetical protein
VPFEIVTRLPLRVLRPGCASHTGHQDNDYDDYDADSSGHRRLTMASHGDPEIFAAPGPAGRPQHPLTTEEKLEKSSFDIEASPKSSEYGGDLGKARPEPAEQETGILARMREWEAAMDRKLGIESQAIERKLPEDRVDLTWKDSLTMASLWASGTMNLSCFATGFIGWEMGLDLK